MAVATAGLVELWYLERELSGPVQQAAQKLPDDDLKANVREFGEVHARHAEGIDRILRREHAETTAVPEGFKEDTRRLVKALETATDLTSIMIALVQSERRIAGLYGMPLEADLPGTVATTLERQRREEQRHVDFLENRGAIAVPELADIGDADGTGSAEDV